VSKERKVEVIDQLKSAAKTVHYWQGKDRADEVRQAVDIVSELIAANRLLIEQYEAVSEFTMGGALTNAPFLLIKETLERIA
jgi:hypothetical protein